MAGDLPPEILCAIFARLRPRWLAVAAMVSLRWRACASDVRARRRLIDYGDDERMVVPRDMLRYAAVRGHVPIVKWLVMTLRFPCTERVAETCARRGHALLLHWLIDRRCPLDEHVAAAAFRGGGLRLWRKAVARGCPYDAWTATVAIAACHREDTLMRLAADGCPHDDITVAVGVALGRFTQLRALGVPQHKIDGAREKYLRLSRYDTWPVDILMHVAKRSGDPRKLAMLLADRDAYVSLSIRCGSHVGCPVWIHPKRAMGRPWGFEFSLCDSHHWYMTL